MARRYLFSDESGNLHFSRNVGATRYFAVGTILINERELWRLRQLLAQLRDDLAWANQGLDSYFHASENDQAVRNAVFQALANTDFVVDATLFDKPKVDPHVRVDDPTFYRSAWLHHMKRLAPQRLQPEDQLMVVAAELGTKRTRKAFRDAIEQVLTEVVSYRVKRTLAFWPCSSDFALQAVDFCVWAVFRKWEIGDDTYYKMIADKVGVEVDLFAGETRAYF